MDLDALLTLVCGGYVVLQSMRAFASLVNLPQGTLLDAMRGADVADEDDLRERSPAQRNRYRNCADETAAVGLTNERSNPTMNTSKSAAAGIVTRPAALTAGSDTPTPQPTRNGSWDFRDFGAFLRVNDPAWVRGAAAQDGPSLVSALGGVGLDPDSSAAEV
ncbi:MAG: hypothetical protein AB7O64_15690 [Methylibium sp.]